MNDLQKRFEEMQERLEGVIRGQRDTIVLYEENNKKLRSQLTWRKVEDGLPEHAYDKNGNGIDINVMTGEGDGHLEAISAEYLIDFPDEYLYWLPIPKLD